MSTPMWPTSDPRRDAVNFIIERARRLGPQKDWRDILKDEAEWAVAGSDPAALKVTPERIVCYASVTFADGVGAGDFTDRRTSTEHVLPILLGNTSIEDPSPRAGASGNVTRFASVRNPKSKIACLSFGDPNWVTDTANRLGLECTVRPCGRPKKQS
jgi:hypothetical protein